MKSIIQDDKRCIITGHEGYGLHKHHVFGGSNRELSERYGLWVWLRWDRHIADSPHATPHNDRNTDLWLKRITQRRFEEVHGTREDFVKLFSRNYLGDEE